jgi:putative aldouronate transport system substrate-binding protein
MTISRRAAMGAMAGIPFLATGCSILSGGGGKDDDTLHLNYGGSADTSTIPSPNAVEEKLEDEVGFKVVSERSPEDVGAALAGGQAPDIFLSSRSSLQQFDTQGLVLDLAPYRDRLADYEKFVGTDNLENGIVDDRLIGLFRKPREFSYGALWIRNDWLKDLDLSMPKTTDDLTEVLKAFKEEKPGRKDAVPLTGNGMGAFDEMFGAFGACSPKSFYGKDGDIVNGYHDPDITDPLEYIHGLIDDGLVDPDIFSIGSDEARDRAFQGSAGVIATGWDNMKKAQYIKAQKEAQPDADWQMIDVLSAPGKKGGMPTSPFGAVQGIPASVKDDEKRLDALLDLINYICTDEGSRLVMFGVEGEDYDLDGDDVKIKEGREEDTAYTFAYQMAGRAEDTYLAAKFPDARDAWKSCMDRKQLVQYEALVAPPEDFNRSDADTYGDEQMVLFMSGERPMKEWDAFVKELNDQFDYDSYVESAKDQLGELGYPE